MQMTVAAGWVSIVDVVLPIPNFCTRLCPLGQMAQGTPVKPPAHSPGLPPKPWFVIPGLGSLDEASFCLGRSKNSWGQGSHNLRKQRICRVFVRLFLAQQEVLSFSRARFVPVSPRSNRMPVRICTSSERQQHGDWRKLEVLKPNIAPLHTILQHFAHLEIVGPSLRVYSLPRFQYRERSSDGNTGFSGFLCHSRQTQNEPHIPDRAKIIKKWGCSYPKLVQKHQSKLSFKLSTTGQSPIWLLSKTLVSCGLQLQIETESSERLWTYLLFKEIYIIYIYIYQISTNHGPFQWVWMGSMTSARKVEGFTGEGKWKTSAEFRWISTFERPGACWLDCPLSKSSQVGSWRKSGPHRCQSHPSKNF